MVKRLKKIISLGLLAGLCFACAGISEQADVDVIEKVDEEDENAHIAEKAEIIAVDSTSAADSDIDVEQANENEKTTDTSEINLLQDKWIQCDLSYEEIPAYDYFINAYNGHYDLTLENSVAYVIRDYTLKTKTEEESWKLKRICYNDGIYHAYVESGFGNEMYILILDDMASIQPQYIIAADIKKNNTAKILLQDEVYSYDSMVEWSSYEKLFDGAIKMKTHISMDLEGYLYDSIYENCGYYALYDYLDKTNEISENEWKIDNNMMYIGTNGYIADMTFVSGNERVNMLIDVWNKSYAVLE